MTFCLYFIDNDQIRATEDDSEPNISQSLNDLGEASASVGRSTDDGAVIEDSPSTPLDAAEDYTDREKNADNDTNVQELSVPCDEGKFALWKRTWFYVECASDFITYIRCTFLFLFQLW